jgi:hypothetical protein
MTCSLVTFSAPQKTHDRATRYPPTVADDKQSEPKQTTPKGLEIPVPKRKDVMDALRKVSKPKN